MGFRSWQTLYLHAPVCMRLSGPRPVASQMGVCEEDYHCKPALPTHTLSRRPTFTRPTFHSIQSSHSLRHSARKRTWHLFRIQEEKNGTVTDGDCDWGRAGMGHVYFPSYPRAKTQNNWTASWNVLHIMQRELQNLLRMSENEDKFIAKTNRIGRRVCVLWHSAL